jgi:NADPH:quinone reductase
VVSEVGPGVTGIAVGDHVSSLVRTGGGYSTHAVVPASGLFKLPRDIDFATAVSLLIQGLTAYFLSEEAGVAKGETVVVAGAGGGMGSLAVQVAVLRGATVIGLASENKHAFVRRLGAVAAISYRSPGWSKQVLKITEGRGADVLLDSQGDLSDLDVFNCLARGGRWLMHGWQEPNPADFPADRVKALIYKNMTLRGYSADWNTAQYSEAMKKLMGWVVDGALKVNVTKYPLSEAVKAHQDITARTTTGKVVLIP